MFIQDVFYSFQGEGPFIGYPQIFLRFYGCNIACSYCDEPDKNKQKFSKEELFDLLEPLQQKPVHSISLTGGEPLLQVEAIRELAPGLRHPLYLETNGLLPKNLEQVIDLITYFSVDYKPGYAQDFKAFIALLQDKPHVFVKLVLTHGLPMSEVSQACHIVHDCNPTIPFIIQPVTPFGSVQDKATSEEINQAFSYAQAILPDVRIIPQTHKFMGLK